LFILISYEQTLNEYHARINIANKKRFYVIKKIEEISDFNEKLGAKQDVIRNILLQSHKLESNISDYVKKVIC
jgi:hypothetical protein